MSAKNLPIAEAAKRAGMSPRTLRERAKTDPDCPPIIKMSPRITIVNEDALTRWIDSKADRPVAARASANLYTEVQA